MLLSTSTFWEAPPLPERHADSTSYKASQTTETPLGLEDHAKTYGDTASFSLANLHSSPPGELDGQTGAGKNGVACCGSTEYGSEFDSTFILCSTVDAHIEPAQAAKDVIRTFAEQAATEATVKRCASAESATETKATSS